MQTSDQESLSDQSVVAFSLTNTVDMWLALKRHYVALRGATPGANGKAIPQTTGRDVMAMATGWEKEFSKVSIANDVDRRELLRLRTLLDDVAVNTDRSRPDSEYNQNLRFWDETQRLALYLESRKVRPSRWHVFRESVSEAVDELPETLSHAASVTRDAVGKVLSQPMKWLLLAGGIVLVPVVWRQVQKSRARRVPRLRHVHGTDNVFDVIDEREVGS